MNEHVKEVRAQRPSTRAAEGLPRRRWTTAELERCVDAGVIDPDERFELIGGEIVPMSPTGRRHELVAELLERALRCFETDAAHVVGERQLNLADDTYTKPDILIRPGNVRTYDARGESLLLVVEVAGSGRQKDLTAKAQIYARHGVREYWVVDAETLTTTVHTCPDTATERYGSVMEVPGDRLLAVEAAPRFAVRLCDLEL